MKIGLLAHFSVTKTLDIKENKLIQDILIEGEDINLAFTHVRDKVWFTNKRIIALDVQGLTGSKKEFRIFPYSRISSFSIETAATFDGDSDMDVLGKPYTWNAPLLNI